MEKLTTIDLAKEYLKFSAAHFTIFSATERERLHGHNFAVAASFTAPIDANGLCFSYGDFKQKLEQLCRSLDEYLLLPGESPHLEVRGETTDYRVVFDGQEMRFLKSDTLVLPIRNISVEELASYLLGKLLEDTEIASYDMRRIEVRVSSGPGQWGSCEWQSEGN